MLSPKARLKKLSQRLNLQTDSLTVQVNDNRCLRLQCLRHLLYIKFDLMYNYLHIIILDRFMRQGRTLLHRFTIILLILGMLVQLTGCSDLLDGFAIGDIETFVNETFSSFMANPSKTDLNQYSKKKYDFSVSDEQLDVFYYSLRNADFQIKDTSVGSSRESGKCTVEFKNVPDITKLDQTVGTFDGMKRSAFLRRMEVRQISLRNM